jgi:hypothetical protein
MQIIRIQYARVPRIQMLNHRFRPDVNHLIVTLDVTGYEPPASNSFLKIYQALAELFPTLSRHSCCEEWENTPLFLHEEPGVSIKSVGEVADVAHLVEHVIVDLQCAVSGMHQCSGITCGHRSPENRFDLYVECLDPRVGVFAAMFATSLVTAMLTRSRLSQRHRNLASAARLLLEEPDLAMNPAVLSLRMQCCPAVARWAVAELASFGLVNLEGSGDHEHTRKATRARSNSGRRQAGHRSARG